MSSKLKPPDPERFDLKSFADLLADRAPIIGEDPGSFEAFREGMMQSLRPMTPYEGVIAENLIAIEWELLQHRRMRDAGLRKLIKKSIQDAVVKREKAAHEEALDDAWEKHEQAGGTNDDWEEPFDFDEDTAKTAGAALANKAVSNNPKSFRAACNEIEEMGLDALEVMGNAYRSAAPLVTHHEEKIQELERRRRKVKRDFDAFQSARPVEGKVING